MKMDDSRVDTNEARRVAAARVKTRKNLDKTLPGYNRRNKKAKPKQSKPLQKPTWNDRFFLKEDSDTCTRTGSIRRKVHSDLDKTERDVAQTDTLDNNDIPSLKILTDRQDGIIMATAVLKVKSQVKPSNTLAVSPFKMGQLQDALKDDTKMILAFMPSQQDVADETKTAYHESDETKTAYQDIETFLCLSSYDSTKKHKIHLESVVEYIIEDLLIEITYDIEEALVKASNEILQLL